ncbi:lachrymatory-factor synthase [Dioscorea cayenensis subsp. rotundata]|uniref:Lachrymatory-factor synthase n=1 Tax=Dioscorea cayennensis subsp. rotundata TaxID=55577 RepID=A0AB40AN20_DIOCR|nr:lachrymatory-factor synthase [Dioscorea cayenensis subsp. rotundata]
MDSDPNPNQDPKWEGRVQAKLRGPTAEEAWSLLQGFCTLDKWVPSIHTCYKLEGQEGQPGCIRYCAGPVNRSDNNRTIGWSKEKLTAFDPLIRSYSYEILETNKGFGSYSATIRVVSDPGACEEDNGCGLEWSFVADPIRGWTRDEFVECLEKMANEVARRVEDQVNK